MENPLYMQTGTINFINWTFNFSVTLDGIYDIISQRQHSDTLTVSNIAKQTNKVFDNRSVCAMQRCYKRGRQDITHFLSHFLPFISVRTTKQL